MKKQAILRQVFNQYEQVMEKVIITANGFMKSLFQSAILIMTVVFVTSCASHKTLPAKQVPPVALTVNHYEFGIENQDRTAKCDRNSLTAYYKDFIIKFRFDDFRNMIFEIENKSNKSLIIDKSKCFVLYNGYSTELFKDMRTGRMTTYNNVDDAVNSVQTNESSITMSIPPYSKWILPIEETNIKSCSYPKKFERTEGNHPLTPYSSEFTIEFVIPYSYDYKVKKWGTSRNRLYIDNIRVDKKMYYINNRNYRNYVFEDHEMKLLFAQDEDLREWDEVIKWNSRTRFGD